tara:strand:+ start:501 stop:1169 length:669 start_codon:yes stop_codon:yes gene_type:complete
MNKKKIMQNIKWLGQSGFVFLLNEKLIVIDPYETSISAVADIILITHPHWDHLSLNDIEKFKCSETLIYTEPSSAKIIGEQAKIIDIGDEVTIDGINIKAVRAYNRQNDKPHLKDSKWLGFIISDGDTTIYHAGDTDLIPEMEKYFADIALVPVSGTYVMDVKQAIKSIKRIAPKFAIPMHYNPNLNQYYKIFPGVGTAQDAKEFCRGINEFCDGIILDIIK